MKIETVAFLYTLPELYAVIRLTGGTGVPGFSQEESDFQSGLEELERNMLLNRSENTAILDRVTAFLGQTVGCSRRYICLTATDSYVGMFYNEDVTVLLRLQQGRWVLTPYQESGPAEAELEELLQIQNLPLELLLCRQGEQHHQILFQREVLPELLHRGVRWILDNTAWEEA